MAPDKPNMARIFLSKQLFALDDIRRVWLGVFLFTTVSALTIQLVILPHFAPGLHAGNGLLVGGDWVGFHKFAEELAGKIARQGWGVWELRAERQAPVGIAAAVYFFSGPHPWALIPLNAAVHATTAVLLIRLVQPFVVDLRDAALCVLPFVMFPSSLTLYGQIHKDGAFFLGMFFCLYGWVLLSRIESWDARAGKAAQAVAYIFIGCFLIWVMRTYGVKLIQAIGFIFAVVLTFRFVRQALRGEIWLPRALFAIAVVIVLPFTLGVFKDRSANGDVTFVTSEILEPTALDEERKGGIVALRGSFASKVQNVAQKLEWKKTSWVPSAIDNAFLTLSIVRYGYSGSEGGSNIDTNVQFQDIKSFFLYLPRSIQIGFAAPFPQNWFQAKADGSSSVLLKISAMEMVIVYSALLFLPCVLWRWRTNPEVWLISGFCTFFILLYTYITPNIGSLYRSRHGFLLLLVALGISGFIRLGRSKSMRHAGAMGSQKVETDNA